MAGLQESSFQTDQICTAIDDFSARQEGDLSFSAGENLRILRKSEMMYWYIAQNERGEIGAVPGNYIIHSASVMSLPSADGYNNTMLLADRPNRLCNLSALFDEDYQEMSPGVNPPVIPPKQDKQEINISIQKRVLSHTEKQMLVLLERDKLKRLCKGTLVAATATYRSKSRGDLNFNLHDEMIITEPTKDLCWYKAYKMDKPLEIGIIPLTHVRVVYMSDEDGESEHSPAEQSTHDRIYEDKTDFLSNSGWFTYPGYAIGTEAHFHILARKAEMTYDNFMSIKSAVYLLQYMSEKSFVGKAEVLHEELAHHFECFGKRRKNIREVDDDLCHHTYAGGWKLMIWPMEHVADMEFEFAKKIVEHDSLLSLDGGMNESMVFTSSGSFEKFWEWLSPN